MSQAGDDMMSVNMAQLRELWQGEDRVEGDQVRPGLILGLLGSPGLRRAWKERATAASVFDTLWQPSPIENKMARHWTVRQPYRT